MIQNVNFNSENCFFATFLCSYKFLKKKHNKKRQDKEAVGFRSNIIFSGLKLLRLNNQVHIKWYLIESSQRRFIRFNYLLPLLILVLFH